MKPSELAPGIHYDYPAVDYLIKELGVASKSALDAIARSASKYYDWVLHGEREPTPALQLGTAVHCAMLEPRRFAREYIAEPEWGPCRANTDLGVTKEEGRANKERRDAWRVDRAGLLTLTASEARTIRGMVESTLAHPIARMLLENGAPEVTVRWDDETGIACKARIDYMVERVETLVDLKSTEDASPDGFWRSVMKYRYHRQDALYRQGCRVAGRPFDHFVFVAVESDPPYDVAVHSLDAEALSLGERENRRNLDRLAACVESGEYVGYEQKIHTLSFPHYAVKK